MSLVACLSTMPPESSPIEDVYVDDFHSDDVASCGPADVRLDHSEARVFFRRARLVTSREVHDHYDLAPCYVAGPLRFRGKPCSFEIRAGATATITCGDETFFFVCDSCEALFAP